MSSRGQRPHRALIYLGALRDLDQLLLLDTSLFVALLEIPTNILLRHLVGTPSALLRRQVLAYSCPTDYDQRLSY